MDLVQHFGIFLKWLLALLEPSTHKSRDRKHCPFQNFNISLLELSIKFDYKKYLTFEKKFHEDFFPTTCMKGVTRCEIKNFFSFSPSQIIKENEVELSFSLNYIFDEDFFSADSILFLKLNHFIHHCVKKDYLKVLFLNG